MNFIKKTPINTIFISLLLSACGQNFKKQPSTTYQNKPEITKEELDTSRNKNLVLKELRNITGIKGHISKEDLTKKLNFTPESLRDLSSSKVKTIHRDLVKDTELLKKLLTLKEKHLNSNEFTLCLYDENCGTALDSGSFLNFDLKSLNKNKNFTILSEHILFKENISLQSLLEHYVWLKDFFSHLDKFHRKYIEKTAYDAYLVFSDTSVKSSKLVTDDEISQHFKDKKEDFQKFYKSFKRVYESKNKNLSSKIFEDFQNIIERIHDSWYLNEGADYTRLDELGQNTGAFNVKGPDNKDYILKTDDPINLDKLCRVANSDFSYAVPKVIEYFKTSPNKGHLIMEKLGKLKYQKGILIESLFALRDIHSLGITHNDIHPKNLMMSKEGKPKFIDFDSKGAATDFYSRNSSNTQVKGDIIALGRTLLDFKYRPYLKSLEIEFVEDIERNKEYLQEARYNSYVRDAFLNGLYKYKERQDVSLSWCFSLYATKVMIESLKKYFEDNKKLDHSFPSIEEFIKIEGLEKEKKIENDIAKIDFVNLEFFLIFLKNNFSQQHSDQESLEDNILIKMSTGGYENVSQIIDDFSK